MSCSKNGSLVSRTWLNQFCLLVGGRLVTIFFSLMIGVRVLVLPSMAAEDKWSGVDETVVEKFAEQAGRPARKPFINTDQGDILLFVFLLAGAIGGFIGGYYFRALFPPKVKKESSSV